MALSSRSGRRRRALDIIDSSASFGSLIRARRRALGLTQRDLALAVNVGERFIVELENGKPTCQLGKALSVARAVGLVLADCAGRDPPPGDAGAAYPDLPDLGEAS